MEFREGKLDGADMIVVKCGVGKVNAVIFAQLLIDRFGVDRIINTEVEIIGDYGTVLKSYELKVGESARLTLSENTALKISEGNCVLTAE